MKAVYVNVHDRDCARRASANVPIRRLANSNGRGVAWRTYVVVMSPHCEHTKQVHTQTKGADEEKLAGIHLRRIEAGTHS